jgi:hypothetical protein
MTIRSYQIVKNVGSILSWVFTIVQAKVIPAEPETNLFKIQRLIKSQKVFGLFVDPFPSL